MILLASVLSGILAIWPNRETFHHSARGRKLPFCQFKGLAVNLILCMDYDSYANVII